MSEILQQIYSAEQEAKGIIQKGEADARAFETAEQENTRDEAARIRQEAQKQAEGISLKAAQTAQKQTAETLKEYEQKADRLKQKAEKQKDAVASELLQAFFGV